MNEMSPDTNKMPKSIAQIVLEMVGKQLSDAVPTGPERGKFPPYAELRGQRNDNVATFHPDLQQHSTGTDRVLAELRSNPYSYVGESGFNSAFGATDRPAGAPGDRVTVHDADFMSQCGSYRGMNYPHPSGDPSNRPDYDSARQSATPPNPSYPMGNATSRNPMSAKVSNLELMKEYQRRMV